MSKIQQLINVAGEVDTLSQTLGEFFREYLAKQDDAWASDLYAQTQALGQNARVIDCEDHTLTTRPIFPVGSRIIHTKSNKEYRITQDPSSGLRIEGTNEPAYEYMAPLGIDDQMTKWVRAQSEVEDSRFIPVIKAGFEIVPSGPRAPNSLEGMPAPEAQAAAFVAVPRLDPARERSDKALGLLKTAPPTGAEGKFPIQLESRRQEANGWVDDGMYHNAMFDGRVPPGIKGCPAGRSQVSAAEAIRDLVLRTNGESGTALTVESLEVSRYSIGQAYWKPHSPGAKSGPGWRCQTCATWIAAGEPFDCKCSKPIPAG
jgi:hypothetical protein